MASKKKKDQGNVKGQIFLTDYEEFKNVKFEAELK